MEQTIKVGQKIRALKMAQDSFYQKAEGIVTKVSGDFVCFDATMVMSKWDCKFHEHPTGCATSAKIEDVVVID